MKIKLLAALFATGMLSACGGSSSNDSEPPVITPPVVAITKDEAMTQLLAAQADNYILPAYASFKEQSEEFEQASLAFCSNANATASDLTILKDAWLTLSSSWQFAKAIKMGPESEEFRHFRLQFWPDANNVVRRGVSSLLAAQTIDVNTVASLQDGAQGLPALEVLIFNTEEGDSLLFAKDKVERCLAVMAIAENVKNIATEIDTLWRSEATGFAIDFKNGSGEYDTKQAVLEDFITNWFELIEVIKDNKINDVKGILLPGSPDKAESNLSLSSFENIKRNFAALEAAYLAGDGYGFDQYLSDIHENREVNDTILGYFEEINGLLNEMEVPLAEAVEVQNHRDELVTLINKIDEFRSYLSTDFIQVTGLNPNFNSNDGD